MLYLAQYLDHRASSDNPIGEASFSVTETASAVYK